MPSLVGKDEVRILIDAFDLAEIERAASIIDSINHNPHVIPDTDGLSQSLWAIVGTIRHAQEEARKNGQ